MARRKTRTRTIYRKAKRGYRKRKGLLSGNIGNVIIGAAAGFGSKYIPQIAGKWTNPFAFGALGYFFKKPAFFSIAGYELGKSFGGGSGNPGHGVNFWNA